MRLPPSLALEFQETMSRDIDARADDIQKLHRWVQGPKLRKLAEAITRALHTMNTRQKCTLQCRGTTEHHIQRKLLGRAGVRLSRRRQKKPNEALSQLRSGRCSCHAAIRIIPKRGCLTRDPGGAPATALSEVAQRRTVPTEIRVVL